MINEDGSITDDQALAIAKELRTGFVGCYKAIEDEDNLALERYLIVYRDIVSGALCCPGGSWREALIDAGWRE